MFVHTSAPLTLISGNSYDRRTSFTMAMMELDLFFFLGDPRMCFPNIGSDRAQPLPPLWSFGLWMSRWTAIPAWQCKTWLPVRQEQIPCDVIHLDTKWFDSEWHCDYQFSPSRFADPQKMMADLKEEGFRISLGRFRTLHLQSVFA